MNKINILKNIKNISDDLQYLIDNKSDKNHSHDNISIMPEKHTHEIKDVLLLEDSLSKKSEIKHTHSTENFSDFPKTSVANGGNVDTVGGFSSSDFSKVDHNHDGIYAINDHMHEISDVNSLDDEIMEIKNNVGGGKKAIADAIKSKGGNASEEDDFASLANQINTLGTPVAVYKSKKIPVSQTSNDDRAKGTRFWFYFKDHFPELNSGSKYLIMRFSFNLVNSNNISNNTTRYLKCSTHSIRSGNTVIGSLKPSYSNYSTSVRNALLMHGNFEFLVFTSDSEHPITGDYIFLPFDEAYLMVDAWILDRD